MSKYFKIHGTTIQNRSKEIYVQSESIQEAEELALATPFEEGGLASWSTEEVEELPASAYIECEKCSHNMVNTSVVLVSKK